MTDLEVDVYTPEGLAISKDGILLVNKIAYYEGGGYDGCVWEPNLSYIDGEGGYHPIICTGHAGRKTTESFIQMLNNEEDSVQLWDADREGYLALFDMCREDFACSFFMKIQQEHKPKEDPVFKCADCGDVHTIDNWAGFEGYRGDGGIGIVNEGALCSDCYSARMCSDCGELVDSVNDLDTGRCEFCITRLRGTGEEPPKPGASDFKLREAYYELKQAKDKYEIARKKFREDVRAYRDSGVSKEALKRQVRAGYDTLQQNEVAEIRYWAAKYQELLDK